MLRFFHHAGRARTALMELWNASPQYRWTFLASILLVLATAILPAWRLLPGIIEAKFIPLHYNIYFGIDRFGPWYGIFLPAGLGALILMANVAAAALFVKTERLLALCFAWGTPVIELALLVSTIFMISLNV